MRIVALVACASVLASTPASAQWLTPEEQAHVDKVRFDHCLAVGKTVDTCKAEEAAEHARIEAIRQQHRASREAYREKVERERAESAARAAAAERAREESRRKEDAEARAKAAAEEFAAVYIARRHALALASARLCTEERAIAAGRESIREEHAAARHSGVVDKLVLYEAGQLIRESEEEAKEIRALIKKGLKRAPLACRGVIDELADCIDGHMECWDAFGRAQAIVMAQLRGEDVGNLELREKDLRGKFNPRIAQDIEAQEQRIAYRLAGKKPPPQPPREPTSAERAAAAVEEVVR